MQPSACDSTAYFTPAVCSISATALVVFLALSSYAPAQPTQKRYSVSSKLSTSSPHTGTTTPSWRTSLIQSARVEAFWPHGLPLVSRFLNRPASSVGKSDSTSTW